VTDAPRPAATWRVAWIAVGVSLAIAASALLITHRGGSPADPPSATATAAPITRTADNRRDAAGSDIVHRLQQAVRSQDRTRFMALTEPEKRLARARLHYVFANIRRLRVTDFRARYLGADGHGAAQGRWHASAEVSWGLRGFNTRPVVQQTSLTFESRDGRTYLERIGLRRDNKWPLWAVGPLSVRRHDGAVAVAVGAGRARTTLDGAERAIDDVRAVIGRLDAQLLVIAPATALQFDRVVGVAGAYYANIAAVTTTADGSLSPRSLITVDVNPSAFGRLGPLAAQVVLSHEATHAATRSVTTSLPAWLEEGFADYVALRDMRLSPGVVAAGLLRRVRSHGVPAQLPSPAAFAAGAQREGQSYEAAWLACLMIARQYGQRALVHLYAQAGKAGVGPALHRVLQIGPVALTSRWRAYLEKVAGG
jgi:hypothetical protein